MRKFGQILLLVALSVLLSLSLKETNTVSFGNLCNRWKLVKMTDHSEKTHYITDENIVLEFKCKNKTWSFDFGNEITRGTWELRRRATAQLIMTHKGDPEDYIIKHLDKNRLIISGDSMTQEFERIK